MKYFKRLKIYKASAVTFNPQTMEAYSYSWWKFVAIVEGKVIFNDYYYSPSTRKHQSKVRSLLQELGITIDISMPLPAGIVGNNLQAMIEIAEETLCNKFLSDQLKAQDLYQRTKRRKLQKRKQETEAKLGHVADCTELYKQLDKVNLILVKG